MPPLPPLRSPQLKPPKETATTATVHKGEALYQRFCSNCHGDVAVSGGVLPDLRYSAALGTNDWTQIIREGLLQPQGMVSFSKELSPDDVEAIRAYVIFRANQSLPPSTTPTH